MIRLSCGGMLWRRTSHKDNPVIWKSAKHKFDNKMAAIGGACRPAMRCSAARQEDIIPRCSWHESPSHMMLWQSGRAAKMLLCHGKSLSYATHVKSLSRQKVFLSWRPLNFAKRPFATAKLADVGRHLQMATGCWRRMIFLHLKNENMFEIMIDIEGLWW